MAEQDAKRAEGAKRSRSAERPGFLEAMPKDEELSPLIQLFEEGNFLELRRRARELDRATVTPEVAAAIDELVQRTNPDPLLKWMLLICFGLFAFIVAWDYANPH